MTKVLQVLATLVVLLFGFVAAQDAPTLTQHFKPGDTLRYLVRFEGNPTLNNVSLSFGLLGSAACERSRYWQPNT